MVSACFSSSSIRLLGFSHRCQAARGVGCAPAPVAELYALPALASCMSALQQGRHRAEQGPPVLPSSSCTTITLQDVCERASVAQGDVIGRSCAVPGVAACSGRASLAVLSIAKSANAM